MIPGFDPLNCPCSRCRAKAASRDNASSNVLHVILHSRIRLRVAHVCAVLSPRDGRRCAALDGEVSRCSRAGHLLSEEWGANVLGATIGEEPVCAGTIVAVACTETEMLGQRIRVLLVLVLSSSAACSGKTTHGPSADQEERDDAGSSAEEAPSEGAGADGEQEPDEGDCAEILLSPFCVHSCESPIQEVRKQCVDGKWRCPDGSFESSECPPGSCGSPYPYCCDIPAGQEAPAACRLQECLEETSSVEEERACLLQLEDASECLELDGLACDTELECADPGRCSPTCSCSRAGEDLGHQWSCVFPLC